MFNYRRLFLGLVAMVFLAFSYKTQHSVYQILIPPAVIIIACGICSSCVQNRLCAFIFSLMLSLVLCPLLVSGRDAYQVKDNPQIKFDTRVGTFFDDIEFCSKKVAEITHLRNKSSVSVKRKGDDHPNYYPHALCWCSPGTLGIFLSRKGKKNAGKKN